MDNLNVTGRDLTYEDLLYIDFRDNNNGDALEELIRHTNSWLFAIVITFVFDENMAEDILDETWQRVVRNKYNLDISNHNVLLDIYKIAKKLAVNNGRLH